MDQLFTAGDRVAIFMLGIMALALSVVALLCWGIYKNSVRPNTPEEDLFEELEQDQRKEAQGSAAKGHEDAPRKPYERDPDWWKNSTD